jgi:hypothetical protein
MKIWGPHKSHVNKKKWKMPTLRFNEDLTVQINLKENYITTLIQKVKNTTVRFRFNVSHGSN